MFKQWLIEIPIRHSKWVVWGSVLVTLSFLAAFPSLRTDTDPVKMLPQDNPAITLYEQIKGEFKINDLVVLGIESRDGSSLFTPEALARIDGLTREILKIKAPPAGTGAWNRVWQKIRFLRDPPPTGEDAREIIIVEDVMSLATVDDIVRNEAGELELVPLMARLPRTAVEAKSVLARLNNNPLFAGKIAAEDGSLVGIYVPLREGKKNQSYYLGEQMKRLAERHLGPGERFHLAGLPIAENTFGNEMFVQMGVYAPASGLVIFLLLLFFFRNVRMVIAPMALAIMTVIWAMGALIYSGSAIHIMSSMIPIFLMPIAVLNSIHILSALHDQISNFKDRAEAVRAVLNKLFNPMLFTSVTTVVGFVSLSTTGIPPVVVFGLTIGFGVAVAWLLSMLFIPAYFLLLPESALKNFGRSQDDRRSVLMEVVQIFLRIASRSPRVVIVAAVASLVISSVGVTRITINDNPVRWFKKGHVLREADAVMNRKLAGTYMANLYFSLPEPKQDAVLTEMAEEKDEFAESEFDETETFSPPSIRDPRVIAYMSHVGDFLESLKDDEGHPIVGGVTSIVDILAKVGAVAMNDPTLPESREKVSQYMFLFESGDRKKGRDMWKFITRGESRTAQMWVQMKSGDNQKMSWVMRELAAFKAKNPPPALETEDGGKAVLKVRWSGLTHINNVWQDEMVRGMVKSLAGAFLIVSVMMALLFRSVRWGLLAMLPLTLTIVLIYGVIGFSGKFYDMPIAVLSSLTLGLSVDFAIHFIESARSIRRNKPNVLATLGELFGGTGRAIWRNVLVISVGFIPLFFATLVPYVTVGAFFFGIMLVSGITTLILLSAILIKFHRWLPGM